MCEWFDSGSDPNWDLYYSRIDSFREKNRFMAQCYRLASACNYQQLHIPPPPHRPTGQPYVVEQCVSADSVVVPEEDSMSEDNEGGQEDEDSDMTEEEDLNPCSEMEHEEEDEEEKYVPSLPEKDDMGDGGHAQCHFR